MKAWFGLVIAALVCVCVAAAGERAEPERSTYTDALYGFSLQAPRFPEGAPRSAVFPVCVMAPSHRGHGSNVNVMVVNVSITREEYRKLSYRDFERENWKVNSDTDTTVSGRDAYLLDFEGTAAGNECHWLALTVVDAERVFVITATARKDVFTEYEKEFRACLASFRLVEKGL